jgi:hypothetical protein
VKDENRKFMVKPHNSKAYAKVPIKFLHFFKQRLKILPRLIILTIGFATASKFNSSILI